MDQGATDWAKFHQGEGDRPVGYHGENGGSADTSAYDNLLGSAKTATSDFATGVNTSENNAFNDYLKFIGGQQSSLGFYQGQLDASGVPQLRKTQSSLQGTIYDLEDSLRRVEGDVSANSRNSMVTESQRRGIVNEKQQPIVENLGWQNQSLGRVSSAISDMTGQALTLTGLNSQDQAKIVDAYKTKLELATHQGDRALQAFTTDISNTLNVTLAKIHRGEQVDDTEAANAFQLLTLQKQAEYTMQQSQAGGADNSKRYITLGDGTQLYDTTTGQIIASNQKDYKASGGASEGGWS